MNGKMYLIDTNIFLEILLEQSKSLECEKLLNFVKRSKSSFYVSAFALHSIEVLMVRNKKIKQLREFLSFISNSKIIRVDTATFDEQNILETMEKQQLDFDDALQVYLCQKHNLKIISYDKHFDKTNVERVEPSKITT